MSVQKTEEIKNTHVDHFSCTLSHPGTASHNPIFEIPSASSESMRALSSTQELLN